MLTEQDKVTALENAVINNTAEETAGIYQKLGQVEFTARALGLACRFRGLDMVKALVENGAAFDFANTEYIEQNYNCYAGDVNIEHKKFHITNFSLMVMTFNTKALSGSYTVKGINMRKSFTAANRKKLPLLPSEERIEITKYLYENRNRTAFDPSELLYYAIFTNDDDTVKTLKALGVRLSESRIKMLTESANSDGWTQYCSITRKMTADEMFYALSRLSEEIGENKVLNYTEVLFEKNKDKFLTPKGFDILLSSFDQKKINKTEMLRNIISENRTELLGIAEKHKWLAARRTRDTITEYAQNLNNAECIAWLLDFKNRTVDLEAERASDEKKIMRELNAKPDSVYIMKQLWSYKKREDGTLIITNYKGTATEVTVPEKIGKNTVTAIGRGTFAGRDIYNGLRYTAQQLKTGQEITKVTLPDTIEFIGDCAFEDCKSLKEVILPPAVKEIGKCAFDGCVKLENIGGICRASVIGIMAFSRCTSLKRLEFTDLTEIPKRAFDQCFKLETLILPETVGFIENADAHGAFYQCYKLTVTVKKGSYAEQFCKKHKIKFEYSDG